jgi:hypothetical protein
VQARVWADYRETLSARMLGQFAGPWVDWTHQKDARARYQAHGSPGNLIDLYAAADIPETETFYASDFPFPASGPTRRTPTGASPRRSRPRCCSNLRRRGRT